VPSVNDYAEARRARPLPVEDRKAMIIDVVTPLVLEYGSAVTSRQIAEAAGIAEGTIFRAFGDKESLLNAVLERFLDPLALHTALQSIDPDLAVHDKLSAIFGLLQDRFRGVIRMMAALGRQEPPVARDRARRDFAFIIGELLERHSAELRIPPERVAQYARVLAFASALPVFDDTIPFTFDELLDLFEHGVIAPTTTTTPKES